MTSKSKKTTTGAGSTLEATPAAGLIDQGQQTLEGIPPKIQLTLEMISLTKN